MIRPYLQEFTRHGGKLRVLTTTYMGATDPKAVAELAALPNTEVRISYNVKETRLRPRPIFFTAAAAFPRLMSDHQISPMQPSPMDLNGI